MALLGAAVVVVNPIFWFDSVVWGQADSVGVVFLLLGLRALWRDQPERARDLRGHRRAREAAARDPHPARGGRDDPTGAVAAHLAGRSRRGPCRRGRRRHRSVAGVGAADRPAAQDPHDGRRRMADDGRAVHPVRPVGAAAGRGGPLLHVRPHRTDRQGRRRLSIPDRQRVQRVGSRAGRPRRKPRKRRTVGVRRRRRRGHAMQCGRRDIRPHPGHRGRGGVAGRVVRRPPVGRGPQPRSLDAAGGAEPHGAGLSAGVGRHAASRARTRCAPCDAAARSG